MTLDEEHVSRALAAARAASPAWRATALTHRLRIIRRARQAIADAPERFGATLAQRRPPTETVVTEVLPLLEAARFLERHAARILAPQRPIGRLPLWLLGTRADLRREPHGVVLVMAPSNYPLFLPGVQVLQALAAGNTVCAKPAPGCAAPLHALAAALMQAGLPTDALRMLPESMQAGEAAGRSGFDLILLTGSARTGRRVLEAAAKTLSPCIMELSGNDAVFVLDGADLDLTADCLAYALRLNGGATCIAPRRVFVPRAMAGLLEARLLQRLNQASPAGAVASGDTRDRVAAGHDTPGRDAPGHDTHGHDTHGHDTPGHDTPGHDAPGHDTPGHASAGAAVPPASAPSNAGRSVPLPPPVLDQLRRLLAEAEAAGARPSAHPDASGTPPIVVTDATPRLGLLKEDVFAPVLSLVPVPDLETALAWAAECPYALGASVFGPPAKARALADRLDAGSVVINDLIVPTADPRLPFGGRHESGFGVTRGAEGLLAMTAVKAVSWRRGPFRLHLRPPRPDDEARYTSLVTALHASFTKRLPALARLVRLGM